MGKSILRAGLVLLCFLCANLAAAQEKTALIIGIDDYRLGPDLRTPIPDARAIAKRMTASGYDTFVVENPTQPELLMALARFRLASAQAATSLIYIAGHGVRWQGETYILATDTPFADATGLLARSVPVGVILSAISDKVRNKIVLIDACRDLPSAMNALSTSYIVPTSDRTSGFAGSYVLFSAQPGAPAYEGRDQHSPFALAVLDALSAEKELGDFDRQVRAAVVARTQGLQVPWSQTSMVTELRIGG